MGVLGDFLSPEAGQKRTKWRNEKADDLYAGLQYYLGPTGVPDKLKAVAELLQFTDAGDVYEAQAGAEDMRNAETVWDAIGGAGRMATGITAAAVPVVGAKMANNLTDAGIDWLGSAVDDFMAGYDPTRVNIFAGVNAKTADLDALDRAKGMADSGAARGDIWRDTGWFQGVDGKWRFEIDDSGARMKPRASEMAGDYIPLDDGFSHLGMKRAYPDMFRDTGVAFRYDEVGGNGFRGSYDPVSNSIRTSGPQTANMEESKSTTLHELQHAAQGREGFATGGNPREAFVNPYFSHKASEIDLTVLDGVTEKLGLNLTPRDGETANDFSQRAMREMIDAGAEIDDYYPFVQEMQRLNRSIPKPDEQYRRLAGEVEARNVQARSRFTPNQRREMAPWTTQDIPDEDQIVWFGDGVASSADPATTRGQEILDLLSTNPSAVTDDMLDMGDPVLNARLNEYLWNNYDLPMDEASRMARAEGMGRTTDAYHATTSDFPAFDLEYGGANTGARDSANAVFTANKPEATQYYAGWTPKEELPEGFIDEFYPEIGREADRLYSGRSAIAERFMDEFKAIRANKANFANEDEYRYALDVDLPTRRAAAFAEYDRVHGTSPKGPSSPAGIYEDGGQILPLRTNDAGYNELDADIYDPQAYLSAVRRAAAEGAEGVTFRNVMDVDEAPTRHNQSAHFDPSNIRSRFARFDPRLAHLSNLNAGLAGLGLGAVLGLQQPSDERELREYLGGT